MEELFLFMEDFDNAELPAGERQENLEEAVADYNAKNGTSYRSLSAFHQYENWQRSKNQDR